MLVSFFFFFNDTATTEIYTLSLHDALPISYSIEADGRHAFFSIFHQPTAGEAGGEPSGTEHYYSFNYANAHFVCQDRKSTRLNSSHLVISYAVFCLKKKKQKRRHYQVRLRQ